MRKTGEVNPLGNMYEDITIILEKCVIKSKKEASIMETFEMTKESSNYFMALSKQDTFLSYDDYTSDMYKKAGVTSDQDIVDYLVDRRSVPKPIRDKMLLIRREMSVKNYVEKNNYYRMLMGVPNLDDHNLFYVDKHTATEYKLITTRINDKGVVEDIPIHELKNDIINTLEQIGFIEDIRKKYPEKRYLNYMGTKRIDLYTARNSYDFTMLSFPTRYVNQSIANTFPSIYEQCRSYYMNTIYMNEYSSIYGYYDNFIGLCIMTMAIQQLIVRSTKYNIPREFFDDYCIELLFGMYDIPVLSALSPDVKQLLAQKLNILIQKKATDAVFYDIADIFAFEGVTIFKYFLVKERRYGENNIPLTPTKIDPDTGKRVPDYPGWYKIYFKKLELGEQDYYTALQDESNTINYKTITSTDPYWWEDAETKKDLYEDVYNYKDTKYLSLNIAYKLSEIMFNTSYLVGSIIDKRDQTENIFMKLPKMFGDEDISLFSVIMGTCALICEVNNLKGEILTTPSKILHVMGFKFEQDFNLIRKYIKDNKFLDDDLIKYMDNLNLVTVDGVNDFVNNIKDLRDILSYAMSESHDIDEFRTFERLYETIFIKDYQQEVFNIGTPENPVYPPTYLALLETVSPSFYKYIKTADDEALYAGINHSVNRLNQLIPNLRNLYIADPSNNILLSALNMLIDFFKSYETYLLQPSVVYIFDTKALCMLKLIDSIESIAKTIETSDDLNLIYADSIAKLNIKFPLDERSTLEALEDIKMFCTMFLSPEYNKYEDIITKIHKLIDQKDISMTSYCDILAEIKARVGLEESGFKSLDSIVHINKLVGIPGDKFTLEDMYRIMSTIIAEDDSLKYPYDYINKILARANVNDSFSVRDIIAIVMRIIMNESFQLKDSVWKIFAKIFIDERNPEFMTFYSDMIIAYHKTIQTKEQESVKDMIEIIIRNLLKDYDKYEDSIAKILSTLTYNDNRIYFNTDIISEVLKTLNLYDDNKSIRDMIIIGLSKILLSEEDSYEDMVCKMIAKADYNEHGFTEDTTTILKSIGLYEEGMSYNDMIALLIKSIYDEKSLYEANITKVLKDIIVDDNLGFDFDAVGAILKSLNLFDNSMSHVDMLTVLIRTIYSEKDSYADSITKIITSFAVNDNITIGYDKLASTAKLIGVYDSSMEPRDTLALIINTLLNEDAMHEDRLSKIFSSIVVEDDVANPYVDLYILKSKLSESETLINYEDYSTISKYLLGEYANAKDELSKMYVKDLYSDYSLMIQYDLMLLFSKNIVNDRTLALHDSFSASVKTFLSDSKKMTPRITQLTKTIQHCDIINQVFNDVISIRTNITNSEKLDLYDKCEIIIRTLLSDDMYSFDQISSVTKRIEWSDLLNIIFDTNTIIANISIMNEYELYERCSLVLNMILNESAVNKDTIFYNARKLIIDDSAKDLYSDNTILHKKTIIVGDAFNLDDNLTLLHD